MYFFNDKTMLNEREIQYIFYITITFNIPSISRLVFKLERVGEDAHL